MRYQIWQIDYDWEDIHNDHSWRFMTLDFALGHGFDPDDYVKMYEGEIAGDNPSSVLERIFVIHNRDDRPAGDRMYSLSMSDIVAFPEYGVAYYVDRVGFKDVTEYFGGKVARKRKGSVAKKREHNAQMSIYQEEDVPVLLQEMLDLLRRAYKFREDPQWVDISVTETEILINDIGAIIEFLDAHKMTPKTSMKKEKTMARIGSIKKRADKNELLSDLVDLLNECAADVQAEIDYYNNKIEAKLQMLNGVMDEGDFAELLELVERVRYYDFEDTPGGIADEIERYFL